MDSERSTASQRHLRPGRQPPPLARLALLALLLTTVPLASAAAGTVVSIGARFGEGASYGDHRQFEGQELFLRVEPAAWQALWPNVRGGFEFAGGRFRNGGRKANALLAGPVLVWQRPSQRWALEAGLRLTWLSEHELGNRDLGGLFQFTSHLGFAWHFNAHLAAALRLQHTSNARIYDNNPGLDLQMLELRYRY